MNNSAKVQYELIKSMLVLLKTKGVSEDPMYFQHCLHVFFGKTYDGDDEEIIPAFIEELGKASGTLRRNGIIEFFGSKMDLNLLLNRTVHSPDRLNAGDYLFQYTTGRSRDDWLTEYHVAQEKDHEEWLVQYARH